MTPYNLVNMAKILGMDVIALTDHNTAAVPLLRSVKKSA